MNTNTINKFNKANDIEGWINANASTNPDKILQFVARQIADEKLVTWSPNDLKYEILSGFPALAIADVDAWIAEQQKEANGDSKITSMLIRHFEINEGGLTFVEYKKEVILILQEFKNTSANKVTCNDFNFNLYKEYELNKSPLQAAAAIINQ